MYGNLGRLHYNSNHIEFYHTKQKEFLNSVTRNGGQINNIVFPFEPMQNVKTLYLALFNLTKKKKKKIPDKTF